MEETVRLELTTETTALEVLGREAQNAFLAYGLQKLEESAKGLVIASQDELQGAYRLLASIAEVGKKIEAFFQPREQFFYERYKWVRAAARPWREHYSSEKDYRRMPGNIRGIVDTKIQEFEAAERLRREAEEARLRAEAEAERKRKEAEARELLLRGRVSEAREVKNGIPEIVAPVFAPPPKPRGIVEQETWSAVVEDLKALVDAVARGEVPLEAVQANQTWLNEEARHKRSAMNVPGVRPVSTKTTKVVGRF